MFWAPIGAASVESLERPFELQEIKDVVFDCCRDKVPGPDRFTMAVFQDCWDVVKDDLLEVFFEFFENGMLMRVPMLHLFV